MRYSGQEDITVGTVIANRRREDLEGLIGFFVNTLVLRADLSDNPPFIELLGRVREIALKAYAHQDVPFERLVEVLQPERDLSRSPLFQVSFNFQQISESQTQEGKLDREQGRLQLGSGLDVEYTVAKFDLGLSVTESKMGLKCVLAYNTDLFEASTIQRLLEHWQILLEGIVASPYTRLADLPLLSAVERTRLLFDWSLSSSSPPSEELWQDLLTLIEAQVARTPDAIAVVSDVQTLSYAHLNQLANQLAHTLLDHGVGPEVVVGVCMQRGTNVLIALLAILKAGGIYFPLDPGAPSERLTFLLQDAKAAVLLYDATSRYVLQQQASQATLDLSKIASQWQQAPKTLPAVLVHPEQGAYLIYTSGSTGWPKGVLVPQRGLSNLVAAQQQAFAVSSSSHVLQFASLSFDASLAEMLVTLLSGASLYVPEPERLLAGSSLYEVVERWHISVVTLPPSSLAVLSQEGLSGLQTVIVAGEACATDLLEGWAVGRRVCNAYGPSEATVCASIAVWPEGDWLAGQRMHLGRPLPQVQLYVLDERLEPVPIGVPGEICLGGIGLARGYQGRAGETAQTFVPHPFSKQPGARLYRTGDRGCWREDGHLEYLGREDGQVKVRGYRIELGEIEAQLREHEAVREAVVMLHDHETLGQHIVAYVTPTNGLRSERRAPAETLAVCR